MKQAKLLKIMLRVGAWLRESFLSMNKVLDSIPRTGKNNSAREW